MLDICELCGVFVCVFYGHGGTRSRHGLDRWERQMWIRGRFLLFQIVSRLVGVELDGELAKLAR